MRSASEVLAVAAVVYDQEIWSDADRIFLDAISKANREWGEALDNANMTYGGGSVGWQAVKNLATRQRDDNYRRALAEFEARDDEEIEQLEAAE
jgi:hypothetical protein